ncbi:MAG: hypothetical protein Q7K03_08910 [Dehalococcoidia bacterium]|nr:hypothetical protein [Dehalococcoidia bacterium]
MRHATQQILSAYLIGKAPLALVRRFIEDVDWDAPNLPSEERSMLLKIEAYLTGIDETFNDESDLQEFLSRSIPVIWIYESSPVITSGAANVPLSGIRSDPIPLGVP